MPSMWEATVEELVERARSLCVPGRRSILGIAGAPGAGKSTLAEHIVEALGAAAAVRVPMDGFHLSGSRLRELGMQGRKGADDTFDAWGYLALMRRIRDQPWEAADGADGIVYAPEFRRDLEEPVGSSIPVRSDVPLVVTEGNYLLLQERPWRDVRALVDEMWFLATDEDQRLAQLIARHERFGLTPEVARVRSFGSDQRNAEVVADTAGRADLIVRIVRR
ncbi:nucleoside/nucleotide kinase family protein [Microbacterium sp. GCS4]|uniref:nucleoside/nucleotide kinase family protein n=1 Tax=Microbacterium sp. GCS4 TaxID=1692239 RepID=UPI000681D978|nr:nucleoside/nucleotide kinase family protein [Microbacterium sp. GCS4]KNY05856.1 hypothetical protein AKH00_08340 [Microbacterium sp. GCS4]